MADGSGVEDLLAQLGEPLAGEMSDAALVEASLARFATPEASALLSELEGVEFVGEDPPASRRGLWIAVAVAAVCVLAFSLWGGGLQLLQGSSAVYGTAASMDKQQSHAPQGVMAPARSELPTHSVSVHQQPSEDVPEPSAAGGSDVSAGGGDGESADVPANATQASPPEAHIPEGEAETRSADELLQQAQAYLSQGRSSRARQTYRRVIDVYPDSREARVSRVTLGRMALSAGRHRQALRWFRRYLADGPGPLSEEAELGRIEALAKLGRHEEEREAIEVFLADPARAKSLYRGRLDRRLSQLLAGQTDTGIEP